MRTFWSRGSGATGMRPSAIAWSVVRFPISRIALSVLALGVVLNGGQALLSALGWERGAGPLLGALLPPAILIPLAYITYWGFVRAVERRRPLELACRHCPSHFAKGAIIGAGLFSATIGMLWAAGCYHVSGISGWSVIFAPLAASLFAGFAEELVLRGIFFRIVEEWLGSWISLAASALLFGLLHLGNPHATLVSALAISLEAGLLLAAAFMLTRTLWLPIGIHFAWNFTQGGIFGVAVSGNEVAGLLRGELAGPELLSGGSFGAEASLFAVAVCLTAGLLFLAAAIRNGRIVRPAWKTRPSMSRTEPRS